MVNKKKFKGGLRKKSKRRKTKKRKKQRKTDKNALPEVDKQLYEIQISDLNEKLERAKEQYSTLETEYEAVRFNLEQLDDDRADVIAYLKRSLQNKIDELNELRERMRALNISKENDHLEFEEKYSIMEQDYEIMKKNLTSELNIAREKLKTLEEFRLQREDLLKKFEEQQQTIDTQEDRHKESLCAVEQEFILKNINMKKEVDHRLLQLSEDLQLLIQSKIDVTTKITMNENYLLNKEIDKIILTCKNLIDENTKLETKLSALKIQFSIIKDAMRLNLQKNSTLKKKLNDALDENVKLITNATQNVEAEIKMKNLLQHREKLKTQLSEKCYENSELLNLIQLNNKKIKLLESEKCIALNRLEKLEKIIYSTKNSIRDILQRNNTNDFTHDDNHDEENSFVTTLLSLLEVQVTDENIEPVENKHEVDQILDDILMGTLYDVGKLGIIPKRK